MGRVALVSALDATWHAQQVELADLSTAGKLIRVADSGHMIHLYRPAAVIAAIRDVVSGARRRR
jgi:pimeloyl-ACP methyl ester carboxylesterase